MRIRDLIAKLKRHDLDLKVTILDNAIGIIKEDGSTEEIIRWERIRVTEKKFHSVLSGTPDKGGG